MPSNHEGFGLTSIEASMARTPVIVNWCAGIDETLPKDWPLKVLDNNVDDFIDLFKNKLLLLNYQKLADKAYKYAQEHFSLENMQKGYEEIYKNI